MKQILFATSNKAKLKQFQFVADYYNFKVQITSVYDKFPQVKPYNEEYTTQYEIIENGALEIFKQVKEPIVVEDSIIEVAALNNLPGLKSNDYLKEKGRQGLLNELATNDRRSAKITSYLGFYDGQKFISFMNIVKGEIAKKESFKKGEPDWIGPSDHPMGGGFNAIFLCSKTPGKTLADQTAQEGLVYGYREPNFHNLLIYLNLALNAAR